MQGFNLLHLSLLGWFPLLCLFWLPLFASLFSVEFLPLTRGVEGGHLFRLTCSVVLRRGSNSANKYCWHMRVALAVDGPHWDCHGPRWHVFPGSTLLRLQGAPQGHCPKWTQGLVHFPVLSCLGSPVLRKSADPGGLCVLCPSQVQGLRWLDAWRAHSPRWAVHLIHLPDPRHSVSWVYHVSPLGSWSQAVTLLAYVNIQDPRKMWLATGSLLTVWWKMQSLGLRLQQPLAFHFWLLHTCFSASGEGGPQMAASCFSSGIW